MHLELERVLDDGEAVGGQAVRREGVVAAGRPGAAPSAWQEVTAVASRQDRCVDPEGVAATEGNGSVDWQCRPAGLQVFER